MEIIGKILTLTLLTIFGAAGAVIYFVDSGNSPSFVNRPVSQSRSYEDEPDGQIDFKAYREHLRKTYMETKVPAEANSRSQEPKSLWTNTFDSASEEVQRLTEENSSTELRENMNYWNDQYHQALGSGQKQEADEAYIKYRNYKEALGIKEALR